MKLRTMGILMQLVQVIFVGIIAAIIYGVTWPLKNIIVYGFLGLCFVGFNLVSLVLILRRPRANE